MRELTPHTVESPEERFNQYHQEALAIAQRMSQQWLSLREKLKTDPAVAAESPNLADIDSLSSPPVTGIQRYFEDKMERISATGGDDINAKSRMMHRLVEDLQRIELEFNIVLGITSG